MVSSSVTTPFAILALIAGVFILTTDNYIVVDGSVNIQHFLDLRGVAGCVSLPDAAGID